MLNFPYNNSKSLHKKKRNKLPSCLIPGQYYYGRNPTEPILANYRNLKKLDTDYMGGFANFMGGSSCKSRR